MSNYQKFITILKKWPINSNRKNRDYGEHLRSFVEVHKEEIFPGNTLENTKMMNSLLRLTENKYFKQNSFTKGATGLDLAEIKRFLSDEFQKVKKEKVWFNEKSD